MTAVQLPEVPVGLLENVIRDEIDSHCPQGKWVTGPNTLALCLKVEMSAQLREYAIQAVHLNAIPEVLREQMGMLRDDFQRYSNGDKAVPFVVLREALVAALNAWDDYTNPSGVQQ